jgi:prophage maintenance system killer protein
VKRLPSPGAVGKEPLLLDGNKRAAWVTLELSIDMNAWKWAALSSVDEAEFFRGRRRWDEKCTASWLRDRIESHF